MAAVHDGTGDGRTGAHSSLFSDASLVSHRTLHSVASTSVARVGASPSSVARVCPPGSVLCCACCGLTRVDGGRALCGSCLLKGLLGGDTRNSCLEHGHEVAGGNKAKESAYSVWGLAPPRRSFSSCGQTGIGSSRGVYKNCMLRRGRVAQAQPGVGQGWWIWRMGAKWWWEFRLTLNVTLCRLDRGSRSGKDGDGNPYFAPLPRGFGFSLVLCRLWVCSTLWRRLVAG